MKNTYLYLGLSLIGLSLLIHLTQMQKEQFTDVSGNQLSTGMANLLNLLIPRIKFNPIDAEPTDQTINRVFLDEDQARLQTMLATKLKKRAEEYLSSA